MASPFPFEIESTNCPGMEYVMSELSREIILEVRAKVLANIMKKMYMMTDLQNNIRCLNVTGRPCEHII